MTRQKLELWLFPPSQVIETEKEDLITNKRFIFMVLLGIGTPIICKLLSQL